MTHKGKISGAKKVTSASQRGKRKAAPAKGTASAQPQSLKFHYIKSNFFRDVYVDGVLGGPTPSGLICMNIWSQRPVIPQVIVQTIEADGELGEEIERTGKEGVVRDVQAALLFDLSTAKQIAKWLNDRIAFTENLISEQTTRKKSGSS